MQLKVLTKLFTFQLHPWIQIIHDPAPQPLNTKDKAQNQVQDDMAESDASMVKVTFTSLQHTNNIYLLSNILIQDNITENPIAETVEEVENDDSQSSSDSPIQIEQI